jgi:hypothetical protein
MDDKKEYSFNVMRINQFCERLYEKRKVGALKSVGVSKEMRLFIESELVRANLEAMRLKEDEKRRQTERFIPYQPIRCDENCRTLLSLGPSMTTLQRKDQRGIIPNNTDQQYVFFYAWSLLALILLVVLVIYSSHPIQDRFTLSVVLLVLLSTLYLLSKDETFKI